MAYLAKECLQLDPDARPTMSEVVQILSTIAPDKSRRRNISLNLFQVITMLLSSFMYFVLTSTENQLQRVHVASHSWDAIKEFYKCPVEELLVTACVISSSWEIGWLTSVYSMVFGLLYEVWASTATHSQEFLKNCHVLQYQMGSITCSIECYNMAFKTFLLQSFHFLWPFLKY